MNTTERVAASRCQIHSNTIRGVCPVDGINSLLKLGSFVPGLLILNPGSIVFQTSILTHKDFNASVDTFLQAYSPEEMERLFFGLYPGAPSAFINTQIDSCTMLITDLYTNSLFNTVVLSLPGCIYVELKPSDISLMVLKHAIHNDYFFT